LGAILLHDAIWVLPATPYTLEQFQWLAVEIGEMEGEAMLWESKVALVGQEEGLVKHFLEQVNQAYREILTALQQSNPDLAALARQYQQTIVKDYFHSELGQRVCEALISARGGEDP